MQTLEEQRNVKWILIISLIMFFVTLGYDLTLPVGGPYVVDGVSHHPALRLRLYINRFDTLLFITTLVIATLFTSGFAKARTYKLTIYLFIASMGLFLIILLERLFA